MDITPNSHAQSEHQKIFSQEHLKQLFEGMHVKFPAFKHERHEPIVNVNAVVDGQLTAGQRVADTVAATVGSWPFIIIQSIILAFWIVLNSLAWINRWDPYPFILLNLALSFQAAYAAPFVMMSQNRQAAKDRLTAENDYKTDVKGEQEICHIMEHLDHQDGLILEIVQRLQTQNQALDHQNTLILQIVERLETQHKQLETQREELLQRLRHLEPHAMQHMLDEMEKGNRAF